MYNEHTFICKMCKCYVLFYGKIYMYGFHTAKRKIRDLLNSPKIIISEYI